MQTSVEPLEGNKVKLSVTVDEAEFDKAVDAAFRRIARDVRIPGFRPGKAPRRVLEARLGKDAARQEALREALPDYYVAALREHDVDAVAPPEIDITSGTDTGPVTFDAVVVVRPQVSAAGYGGLRVSVPSPTVSEEEVDRQIDRLREQFGELRTVTRPARDGDFASIDLRGTRAGEPIEGLTADDYLYELGRGSITPQLDGELRGSRAGDILVFHASLPTPEAGDAIDAPADSTTTPTTTPATTPATPAPATPDTPSVRFQILVKEIREKVLPDVTDEWASDASEFDTVEELRTDLRSRVGSVKRVQTLLATREQTLDALAQLVDEEIPEALVEAELNSRLQDLVHRLSHQNADLDQYLAATGRTSEELLAELREQAAVAVKVDLALRAVADAEGLEATDEDVDAEIARLAEQASVKPAQVRRQLERDDQLGAVRSGIRKGKALAWLLEHVEIVDEEGRPIDRTEIMPSPAAASLREPHGESPEPTAEGDSGDQEHDEQERDERTPVTGSLSGVAEVRDPS